MNEYMTIYEAAREVPAEACRTINGGRISGFTDINPMWRIKKLTELFGPCGIGWYYEITRQWTEQGANGDIAAFTNIDLYVKCDGEWSKPIFGTGGNMFIKGTYTSDECYKMALTDALSVACKALGIGADVYWSQDKTKYNTTAPAPTPKPKKRVFDRENKELINNLVDLLNGTNHYGKNAKKDTWNIDKIISCFENFTADDREFLFGEAVKDGLKPKGISLSGRPISSILLENQITTSNGTDN